MDFSLQVITEATFTPISINEAREPVEIETSESWHDTNLQAALEQACDDFEKLTGVPLAQKQYRMTVRGLRGQTALPFSQPLVQIDTVECRSDPREDWEVASTDDYYVVEDRTPVQIVFDSQGYPFISDDFEIRVTYTAGYADQESIPAKFKQPIYGLIVHNFINRGDAPADLPLSLKGMINRHRIGTAHGFWGYQGRKDRFGYNGRD